MFGDATLFTRADEIQSRRSPTSIAAGGGGGWARDRPRFELSGGVVAAVGRRAHPPRRAVMATALTEEWNGENTSIAATDEYREGLAGVGGARARGVEPPHERTRTGLGSARLAHRAQATLAGLADRHPSRTLILVPLPDEPDGLDADLSLRCFASGGQHMCAAR